MCNYRVSSLQKDKKWRREVSLFKNWFKDILPQYRITFNHQLFDKLRREWIIADKYHLSTFHIPIEAFSRLRASSKIN